MYRLLAIDLDGTLLTLQKLITPRTRNLIIQMGATLRMKLDPPPESLEQTALQSIDAKELLFQAILLVMERP